MFTFISLIFKNLVRQKTRTFLTVFGISIGIATIVTLGVITEGLTGQLSRTIHSGNADFTVAQAGAADLAFSNLSAGIVKKIRKIKGVEGAVGTLLAFSQVKGNPFFFIIGLDNEAFEFGGLNMVSGKPYKDNAKKQIMLGKIAASNMKKEVGDKIKIRNIEYKIVGIYETGSAFQDGGSFAPLKHVQEIENKKGKVSMVFVKVKPNFDIKKVSKKVEKEFDGKVTAIVELSDYKALDEGLKIVEGTSWMISLLAIIIGGIGVMNTIMMSVFERTREIGILRAIGWSRKRILSMILGESTLLGIFSIIFGIGIGLLGIQIIMAFPVSKSWIDPSYQIATFYKATAVGIFVSIIGGIYPSYRASTYPPAEALRYE